MSFPKYAQYKESGAEWLPEVPVGWDVLHLRSYANGSPNSFIDGDWIEAPFITDEGVRLIQTGNIGIGHYKEQGFRYVSPETFTKLHCTEVAPGDVLICRLAEPVGRACIAPDLGGKCLTSVDVCIVKIAHDRSPEFLTYFLSSRQYLQFMEAVARGSTRQRVSRSFLGSVRVPVPTFTEQTQIAQFLDHETAKIDTLIHEQKRLIELLKEKRQAVISHAVTKGLDPDVPMKDSEVEWLGEVPAHWNVVHFRRICSLSQGLQIPQSERFHSPDEGRLPYITIRSLNSKADESSDEYVYKPSKRVVCHKDDILMARTGATGQVVTNVEGAFHNNFFKVNYNSLRVQKEFFVHLLTAKELKSHLLMLAGTTTIPDLNHGEFLGTKVGLPSIDEQQKISQHCFIQSDRYSGLVDTASEQISLLQERRSALISAAVTGKIDVRGWLPPADESAFDEEVRQAVLEAEA